MKKILIFFAVLFIISLSKDTAFAATSEAGTSAKLLAVNSINAQDSRAKILESYLNKWDSPLSAYASTFVTAADKYDLDWRLVAAIAGLESGFGKQIPYNSYNGWGWGIYGDNVLRFKSWDEAIETISKGIRERYLIDNPVSDPYVIGPTYAASPTWAVRVDMFMNQIQAFEVNHAKEQLSISI